MRATPLPTHKAKAKVRKALKRKLKKVSKKNA